MLTCMCRQQALLTWENISWNFVWYGTSLRSSVFCSVLFIWSTCHKIHRSSTKKVHIKISANNALSLFARDVVSQKYLKLCLKLLPVERLWRTAGRRRCQPFSSARPWLLLQVAPEGLWPQRGWLGTTHIPRRCPYTPSARPTAPTCECHPRRTWRPGRSGPSVAAHALSGE